jgi:hypothetical protein
MLGEWPLNRLFEKGVIVENELGSGLPPRPNTQVLFSVQLRKHVGDAF